MNDANVSDSTWKTITAWGRDRRIDMSVDDKQALMNAMVRILRQEMDHDHRKAKYTVKQLGRQLGRAGARIYDLRCQNAELRSLLKIDPTAYRGLVAKCQDQARDLLELMSKVEELEETTTV